jgi:hypothetical protein
MTSSIEWKLQVLACVLYKAELALGLTGKDVNDRQLPSRDRAREILRAASTNRVIEPRIFVLAWLITRTAG